MRVGSGFRLGMARATMALHVKGLLATKRKRLVSIMGDLSNEDVEGPDTKAPWVTSPKVVVPAGEASGSKGKTDA